MHWDTTTKLAKRWKKNIKETKLKLGKQKLKWRECKPLGYPPLGLLYNVLDRKEREDRVTTLKGGYWKYVVNENEQHAPLT